MVDGKVIGKSSDNFALVDGGFQIEGMTYYSAEHAYQALKMRGKIDRDKITNMVPKKGETAWDHGM